MKESCLGLVVALTACAFACAETSVDWTSVDARSAVGTLKGSVVVVATSEESLFAETFRTLGAADWQADIPAPDGIEMLGVGDANEGDTHTFVFTEPMTDVMMFIENFDSSSGATISFEGSELGGISLMSGSPSMTFEAIDTTSGMLETSNATSDGEGDAILKFTGDIRSISFDYASGDGSNGVFYTFAVPEPSAALPLIIGLLLLVPLRRPGRRCRP